MLAANYKKYTERISAAKAQNSISANDAALSLSKAAEGISQRETKPVYNIYKTQKEIEILSKQLRASTETFISQTNQWLQMINELNNALNELGDVEHALQVIYQDIQDIVKT